MRSEIGDEISSRSEQVASEPVDPIQSGASLLFFEELTACVGWMFHSLRWKPLRFLVPLEAPSLCRWRVVMLLPPPATLEACHAFLPASISQTATGHMSKCTCHVQIFRKGGGCKESSASCWSSMPVDLNKLQYSRAKWLTLSSRAPFCRRSPLRVRLIRSDVTVTQAERAAADQSVGRRVEVGPRREKSGTTGNASQICLCVSSRSLNGGVLDEKEEALQNRHGTTNCILDSPLCVTRSLAVVEIG
ncbi:hypothetical protein FI667_g14778, partial [Globisporangium splendens]